MAKGKGGFIGQDGINAPDPATDVTGTAGDGQVTVSWTNPSDVGGAAINGYSVQSNNGAGTWQSFYDLTGAAYDSVNFSVSGQDADPYGLFFRSDGAKMYVAGDAGNDINEYNLSTPWTVSSASYSQNFSVASQESAPNGVFFKTDGTKMFVVGTATDTVYEYALSSAWDISSASYSSVSFSVGSQDTVPTDLEFKTDGTKMFIVGNTGNNVYEYALSSAWVVSSASYTRSFSLSSQETGPTGLFFSSDGLNMVVVGAAGVNKYVLSSAWDISSASYSQAFSVSSQENDPQALFFKSDGTKMYVLGSGSDTVYQYTTGDVDYPTASPVTVTGLTNGTSYTFNVWAINPFGWSSPSDASVGATPSGFAFWVGGATSGDNWQNVIQKASFSTLGNASDWGDLTVARGKTSGCSSATRGLAGGGRSSGGDTNVIDYYSLSSSGNATDFGNLVATVQSPSALANSTRGVWGGGETGVRTNVIQYVTIASTGNASDFGDLLLTIEKMGSAASTTRGLFAGGRGGDIIQYITIASTGNATDFGDLTATTNFGGGASNSTRALFTYNLIIGYVTIASTGNATDFGDLISNSNPAVGAASGTRALFGTGSGIQYVEIASTGNAQDFGDLTFTQQGSETFGSGSTSHGGL